MISRIVAISDFCDGRPAPSGVNVEAYTEAWLAGGRGPAPDPKASREKPLVVGGYLERLPLAAVGHGLCDTAEIWSFSGKDGPLPFRRTNDSLARRMFRADAASPFHSSSDMLGHIAAFGAPKILCIWGLGVDEAILEACASSIKVYNSIDAPALRIPPRISRHFDLVLTGADWQSREVAARHPEMLTAVMPIGPEFASPETFFPLPGEKTYDLIYVAAAQAYKKHAMLFDALARLPRDIRTLCVFGYGELSESLRQRARDLALNVDFVGPPGVPFDEVNQLMNSARIGVVCGVDDGAPAILTEYMLAGLPVLANAGLRCGLQYIEPRTGMAFPEGRFHDGIISMLGKLATFRPREAVLERWTWPHTIARFSDLISRCADREKNLRAGEHPGERDVWRQN